MDETKIKPNHKINKFLRMLQMHIIPFFTMFPDTNHHNLNRKQLQHIVELKTGYKLNGVYQYYLSNCKELIQFIMKTAKKME